MAFSHRPKELARVGQSSARVADTRLEILRLVGMLRASQATRAAPGSEPPARALPPAAILSLRPPAGSEASHAKRNGVTIPPPLALIAPREASLRPRAREDLAELRRAIEDGRTEYVGLATSLSRVEERLKVMEERLAGLGDGGGQAPAPSSRGKRGNSPPEPSSAENCAFSGRVNGQMVPDMLQLASSNRMTGVFKVELDGGEIDLFFDEGRIFHATGQGLVGENAFFAVFGAESGRYRFEECAELPREQTLTQSTQFLILEALRRIDEESGG